MNAELAELARRYFAGIESSRRATALRKEVVAIVRRCGGRVHWAPTELGNAGMLELREGDQLSMGGTSLKEYGKHGFRAEHVPEGERARLLLLEATELDGTAYRASAELLEGIGGALSEVAELLIAVSTIGEPTPQALYELGMRVYALTATA